MRDPEDDLESLLEDLSRRRLLSDERYGSRAPTRCAQVRRGAHRARLRAKGLDKGLAEQTAKPRARRGGAAAPRYLAQEIPGRAQDPRGAGQADALSSVTRVFHFRRDPRGRRRPGED